MPEAFGGAWAFCGPPLVVLKRLVDRFFRDEGPGMGGERHKYDLKVRLAVFQFLDSRGPVGLFGGDFW